MTSWLDWRRWSGSTLRRSVIWSVVLLSCATRPVAAQTPCTGSTGACIVDVGKPFTVQFDAPAGPASVTGYRVYLDGVKHGPDIPTAPSPITVLGVSVTTPGLHELQASAYNADGESPKTPALALNAMPPPDTTPPSQPINLTATTTTNQATLSWTASGDNVGVVGYRVTRSGTERGIVTGLTFTEANLTPNTSYPYSVTALDAANNASTAALVTATTLAIPAACMAQGKPYSITIGNINLTTPKLGPGQRGRVLFDLINSFPVTQAQVLIGTQVVGQLPLDATQSDIRDSAGMKFSVPTVRGTYQVFISARDSQGCRTTTTIGLPLVVQ